MARYRTVRRTVLTLAVSAGFIAAAAVPASAMISINHCQPLSDLG
jgi:hypothetical protein